MYEDRICRQQQCICDVASSMGNSVEYLDMCIVCSMIDFNACLAVTECRTITAANAVCDYMCADVRSVYKLSI